jgi:mannose-1-phosphate guanylyltransferase
MLHAMIMAGGSGTRFWPASRHATPKQLLSLAGQETMIQATVRRLGDLVSSDRLLVATNSRLVEPIAGQLPQLPATSIIGEPCKRDTAPAIGLAAALIARRDADATMAVMPADHVIQPDAAFQQAIRQAVALVEGDDRLLVTFGIRPTYAAESFGYIERGQPLPVPGGAPVFAVRRFREKPHAQLAREFLSAGNFYWNSGIFVWKAATILAALRQLEPDLCRRVMAIAQAWDTDGREETLTEQFAAIQGQSIDYAVMEHYDHVAMIEAPFEWDDLGSWRALARLQGTDEQGNTRVGRNLVVRTRNSILRSTDEHLIATIGLKNIIVVHTPDATLVANGDDEESVREIVALIEQRGWEEYL